MEDQEIVKRIVFHLLKRYAYVRALVYAGVYEFVDAKGTRPVNPVQQPTHGGVFWVAWPVVRQYA